jgi:hypothetical protein
MNPNARALYNMSVSTDGGRTLIDKQLVEDGSDLKCDRELWRSDDLEKGRHTLVVVFESLPSETFFFTGVFVEDGENNPPLPTTSTSTTSANNDSPQHSSVPLAP